MKKLLYRDQSGHVFITVDGLVTTVDALPWDVESEMQDATECEWRDFSQQIIRGLIRQLTLLGECVQAAPDGGCIGSVSAFAKEAAEEISVLKQSAHAYRRADEIHGEIVRAKALEDFGRVAQLQAEKATLYRREPKQISGNGGPTLVKGTEPPAPVEPPKPGFFRKFFKGAK